MNMKLISRTRSAKEYFALPKEKREWNGLYKKPLAMPFDFKSWDDPNYMDDGWNEWNFKIKREYPIQWFFREWMTSYDNPVYAAYSRTKMKLEKWYYNVKRFIKPTRPKLMKATKRHSYEDVTNLVVDVNFALILDFWYGEVVDGFVDWHSDEQHQAIYDWLSYAVKWIESEKPMLQEEVELLLTKANKECNDGKTYELAYKDFNDMEKLIDDTDTAVVMQLAKHRDYLWT